MNGNETWRLVISARLGFYYCVMSRLILQVGYWDALKACNAFMYRVR